MNPNITNPAAKRRRIWPWVLGFCLVPFVVVGAVAVSFLTLDREARVLRHEVMAATEGPWQTKIQLSAGRLTVDAVRTVLPFIHNKNIANARMALDAISGASVGVYQTGRAGMDRPRQEFFANTDSAMEKRGWSRLVGVADGRNTVLVYTPDDGGNGDQIDLCVAVIDGRKVVVASTTVKASRLAELLECNFAGDWKRELHVAGN